LSSVARAFLNALSSYWQKPTFTIASPALRESGYWSSTRW
jgi:hypothetical protein